MIKKIALFLVALLPIGLMAQDVKFGHVNSQEIMMLMPERTDIEKQLNDLQNEQENYMVKMRDEYNTKLKDFVDNQATMSKSIKEATQGELAQMEQRINTFSQTAQDDLNKKYQELVAPVRDKVLKAIEEVGSEGNYTYIFDLSTTGIVYKSPKSNDITALVKKKLGITGNAATTTKPTTTKPADTTKPAETKK